MATEHHQNRVPLPLGINNAFRQLWSYGRRQGKRDNTGGRVSVEAAPAALSTEQPKARVVHVYRDQAPAEGRINTADEIGGEILVSRQHSLFGCPGDIKTRFELGGAQLGQGGNAVVCTVRCKHSGKEFACKSIRKVLEGGKWSELKKKGHVIAIRQEVEVLRLLRGSLNIATLEDVYEDNTHVHIVMENCRGGELVHRIGTKHYSERTVASYMRAVLRTLAQCHSHRILHRDIKPGNFLLLDNDDMAPLKAIDFGLAVPYRPEQLPRADLGLEGTPWYMAPEVLSSQVGPWSDVWSAGVMAYQLLTGRFPFDDRRNPFHPSVTRIWQSILCDKPDLNKSFWHGISNEGKDFVMKLLEKDPFKRMTAKQALRHPWLQGDAAERSTGKQLSLNVVQRIQRFGQGSLLKRTVLEHIAEDLLTHANLSHVQKVSCPITIGGSPVLLDPSDSPLQFLYHNLSFGESEKVSRQQVLCSLQRLGYRLDVRESDALMDQLDSGNTGVVAKSQLAASQMDWRAVQQRNTQAWLDSARRIFSALDRDGDGIWSCHEIVQCLQAKISSSEVQAALFQAMKEARKRDESMHEGIDFDGFMTMLRSDSRDSLDQYDDRIGTSAERLSLLLDKSCRAGDIFSGCTNLEPVSEVC